MANPFDQFDGAPTSANAFDQFDKSQKKGPGFARKAGDLAAGFVSGALGATKALTDAAGAGNVASNFLDTATKDVDSLLSPQAQADKQQQSEILKAAEGKGAYEGVKAGFKAFGVAPVQTAIGGLGSVVPTVAATMATGGGAVPAMLAGAATGVAMGAGTIKGSIYDDVKKRSLESGMTPDAAEAAAQNAQAYGGGNTDQIAIGAGLGALDAATGVTPVIGNMARKAIGKEAIQQVAQPIARGFMGRAGMGALGEIPLEAAQGGQEQLATNLAAQRAGFQAGTWDNVASNATLEGLASAGPGAAFGAINKEGAAVPPPAVPPTVPPVNPQQDPSQAPPPQLGFNPMAGTHTIFLDGSVVLNSESSNGAAIVRTRREAERQDNITNPFFDNGLPPESQKPTWVMSPELIASFEESRAQARANEGNWSILPVNDQAAAPATVDPVRAAVQAAADAGGALSAAAVASMDAGASQPALSKAEQDGLASSINGSALSQAPLNNASIQTLQASLDDVDRRAAENGSWNVPLMAQRRRIEDAMTALQKAEQEIPDGNTAAARSDQATQTPGRAPRGFAPANTIIPQDNPEAGSSAAPAPKADGVTGSPINQEWTRFAPESGTLAIPRAEMPQIKAEHRGAMVNFLKGRGIESTQEEVQASSLKPTQGEFSPAKVEQAKAYAGGDRAILVSSDGYVIDGHHQWLAKREAGASVRVIRLGAPVSGLLGPLKDFPSSQLAAGATPASTPPNGDESTPKTQERIDYVPQSPQAGTQASPAPGAQGAQGEQVAQAGQASGQTTNTVASPQASTPGQLGQASGQELAPTNDQVAAKQIPDMTDAELVQMQAHYGPDHKRTAKITKEINRRALAAKLKPAAVPAVPAVPAGNAAPSSETTPQPTKGATSEPQADQAQQAEAKRPQAAAPATEPVAPKAEPRFNDANHIKRASDIRAAIDAAMDADKLLVQQANPSVNDAANFKQVVGAAFDKALASLANDMPEADFIQFQNRAKLPGYLDRLAEKFIARNHQKGEAAPAPAASTAATPAQAESSEQRAKRVAEAGAAWTRMPSTERQALVGRLTGLKPVIQKNLHSAVWENLNGDIQRKLADAMAQATPKADAEVAPGALLQDAMGAAGWVAEVSGEENTIWTKRTRKDRYTAIWTPEENSMEVTVLVDAVDTQIESFKVTDPKAAADAANKAVADDVAESSQTSSDVNAPSEWDSASPEKRQKMLDEAMSKLAKDDAAARAEKANSQKQDGPTPKPDAKSDALTEREKAAKAKMLDALGKLAALASKNTRMNWTPEEEQQLLPIVIELFDGAMELGAVTFHKAVRYVREFIGANLDQETADAIPFETLQGAYIHTARKFKDQGATPGKEVMGFESLADLENAGESADTGAKDTKNGPSFTGQQGPQALENVAPGEDGRAESGKRIRGSRSRRGAGGKQDDSGIDEPGVSGARSGGSGSTSVRAPSARGKGKRSRLGAGGTGADGNGLPEERSPAPVDPEDLFSQPTEAVSANNIQAVNFRITPELRLGKGGEAEKFRDNIAAIRTLKAIEAEGRRATSAEQSILARYVGWGGLASAFPNPDTKQWRDEWKDRGAELLGLLTKKEYDLARRSTLDSHYTSETIVSGMWDAARHMGFRGGLVAETSMGPGNFLGLIPDDLAGSTRFIGVEYDNLTARIAELLYPQETVLNAGLQDVPLPEKAFTLNIGNPPFGDQSLRFQFKPEFNRVSIHNQFFLAGIDSLKPGGVQMNVVSRYLLDAMDKTTRTMLAKKARLISAIRLPDTAFKENARTSVVTDIVILQRLTATEEAEMAAAFDAAATPFKDDKKAAPWKNAADRVAHRELAEKVPSWIDVGKIPDPLGGDPMVVNNWFIQHPEMILGTLERSGKMQFKKDITVRPHSTDLSILLADAVATLPRDIMSSDQASIDTALARHKSMSDGLRIALSRQEAGSIAFTKDGTLEQVFERETPEGDYELAKRALTPESPWSESLFHDDKGRWFTIVAKLDEKGEKVKVVKDGKVTRLNVYERSAYETEADIPKGMLLGPARYERLVKLVGLRDLMVAQINLETEDAPSGEMEANRALLSTAYNEFIKSYGPISRQDNSALVSNMPDGALVQALELDYRKAINAIQAAKLGEKQRKESATPAPILFERVIPKYEPPTKASSAVDALQISLSETGRVDLERMSSLLGRTADEITAEMFDQAEKPLIFKDPEMGQWVTRNDYLTGQVKKKLHAAQAAHLDKNIAELEAVQPEPWGAENVTVLLGSTFVPPNIYADFIQHVTGTPARVLFAPASNSYAVTTDGSATQEKIDEFGADGISIAGMISEMLNSKSIRITMTNADGNEVFDAERTALALIKAKQIRNEFTDWAFADSGRRRILVDLFNEKFNTRVNRQHDGSHLTLPGKVPDAILTMRRHQKNTIWRGISERFMLIDHVVGAGKTFTAIARVMERRRMGLSRKPAIIVPNHMVEQFTADVYRLYPGAKVLAAGQKDFEKKRRRKVFAKIASGDWDVVIIPHSSFGFIGIAPETEERYLEQELVIAEQAIADAWEESGAEEGGRYTPFNVKQAERLRDKLAAKMANIKGKDRKDRLLTFEQMGIDDLTVDEAHEFKNLFYSTRMKDVKGMGNATGSQKAFDLYSKVRVLRESPTGSVTFMTGTPISNSAVEMFNMMRYLAADELKELGLEHFDAWRSQFVSADPGWEPNETGRLKEVTRLGRSWSNMRSLMDLYYSFTDSVSNDDIKKAYAEDNNGEKFPIPDVMDGDRRSVVVQPTKDQITLLNQTIEDFDALPDIEDPYDRNIERLRLMDRARKLSLDVRAAVRGHRGKEPGGKLEKIAEEVSRIYKKWEDKRGTQLIFLDRSVPKSKGDDKILKEYDALVTERNNALSIGDDDELMRLADKLEKFDSQEMEELRAAQDGGWNAYQQIKDNLIANGIPANEIRFIQEATNDAQKQAMFDAVNAGEVRVLIGSTPRMGAGTNVQKRLVGLHHADVTWKPSDIEQREGRIIRQGNLFASPRVDGQPNLLFIPGFEVEILAYATERTIDAKMWSLNAAKLKTINAIRNYDGSFSMDFEDEDSVSMAEMAALASGNPLLMERVKLTSEIDKLDILKRQHTRKMWALKGRLEDAERAIKRGPEQSETLMRRADEAQAGADELSADLESRSVTVEGEEFRSYTAAAKAVNDAVEKQNAEDPEARVSIKVGDRRLSSINGALNAIADVLGDNDPFLAEVGGVKHVGRSSFARDIATLATSALPSVGNGESMVIAGGRMRGFAFEASLERSGFGNFSVELALVDSLGKTVATSGSRLQASDEDKIGTSSLTNPVAHLYDRVSPEDLRYSARQAIAEAERAKKELPELREKAAKPFPEEPELKKKIARLNEVISLLSAPPSAAPAIIAEPDVSTNLRFTGAPEANVTDVVFSRSKKAFSPRAQDQATEAVERLANGIAARWENGPKIVVAFDMQDARIPERVRQEDMKQRSGGAAGTPEGFYYKGTVYLLSSMLPSPTDTARVLFHEALGHHGLRNAFGSGLKPILQQIATMRRAQVDAKMLEYGLRGVDSLDRLTAAEEVLAEMAQATPEIGFVQRAIAAIRTWVRANVPGFSALKLTDAEIIRSFILPARRFVKGGPDGGGPRGGVSFSRAKTTDQTQTAAFKSWFGASKVVDSQGRPLVVYHGTAVDFDAFNPDKQGSNFDSYEGAFPRDGFWFTDSPSNANWYAHVSANGLEGERDGGGQRIMPIYLSIKNPYRYTAEMFAEEGEAGIPAQHELVAQGYDGMIVELTKDDESAAIAVDEYVRKMLDKYGSAYYSWSKSDQDGLNKLEDATTVRDHTHYVAFNPSQIKSATGNNGQFDPANPDIRFSRAKVDDVAARLGDAVKNITVTDLKKSAGFKATDYLGMGLQTLGRRQLVDLYGDSLPLDQYSQLVAQMEADKNEVGAEADKLASDWGKLDDERQLAELMHDATLAQIDPDKPLDPNDDEQVYRALKDRFTGISDGAREVYRGARKAYQNHHEGVRQAIKDRIERSDLKGEKKADLLRQMDNEFFSAIKGVYFPLSRFGQYVVITRAPDGMVHNVSRAETMAEADALRANMLRAFPAAQGYSVGKVILNKEFIASSDTVGRGFMTKLYDVLGKQDMDAAQRIELEDTLGQLYLSSLPDLSWAKHGIHRKGTPGFSQDARRAFAQNMFHGARYLAKLRYSDLMQDELAAMQSHIDTAVNELPEEDGFNGPRLQRVVNEFQKRHESLMNPDSSPLSTALTSFGFVFHLGLSPASALVNLSQTAMVAYPIMGAKWGYDKAASALMAASKQAAKGKNDIRASLSDDEKRAFDAAVKAGVIDVTMAHDLAGIAQGEDSGVMWKIRPVMRWASFLFHHAEKFNRQVTFIAAYRLARESSADHQTAFEQATKATYDGHFDYSAANRPRIMQGNVAKVLLLFKQYGQNMVYTLARQAYLAAKAGTPEQRKVARKALGGLLVSHAMGAGVLGLPLVSTLLAAASMAGGDDDEPWDAKVALQNMLADALGQKPTEVLMHGLSRLTPWDISGRVGLDRLILPDVQEGLEGQRLAESAMTAALGPVAGIAVNVLKGAQEISQGHTERGIESMMPSSLRAPLKAIRYANEGAQDKTGITITDEVSPAAVMGQALGFSPSEVRNATAGKSAIMDLERALNERRAALVRQHTMAVSAGDQEGAMEVRERIKRFNEVNPSRRITMPNLAQGVIAHNRRVARAESGVYLPRRHRDAMQAGEFAVQE